ncbi:MAG: LysR family transcriptional regulator [Rhodospirillum sp.]|nr:LysR family transcriptional regulator [Rhodospirillum sp.]MCF8489423.1 LysR family transcriptional regulator [Rhodospirillum sp.]MCF8501638.1 LysR family transcriptional regulator [Rhodospirillum sp.]
MDVKQLTYFIAVAEELNFSRAATRLNMAQPPLSRQIAQLEQGLGVSLFDRGRNQIALTQAGATLLEGARDILRRVERTEWEVKRAGEGTSGRLRISFVGSATYGVLPNIIKAFRLSFPDVELAMSTMNNAELRRSLIQREIDIAVARPSLRDVQLKEQALWREPLIVAMAETSPFATVPKVKLSDLHAETFVLYPSRPRPSFADEVLDNCRNEGFTPPHQVMATDFQTTISLVSVGVGVSLVPQSVSLSERQGIAYRRYGGYNPGTGLSLVYRRDNLTPHLTNFLKVARDVCREPIPESAYRLH